MQIRTSSLKPFVVFVKPPSFDILVETRQMFNKDTLNQVKNNQDSLVTQSVSNTPQMSARNPMNILRNQIIRKKSSDSILSLDRISTALMDTILDANFKRKKTLFTVSKNKIL